MSQKASNLIERLKAELSIKKDKDLCILLDIKHNTLSTWKKRDTLDFNKILDLCEKRNLDLNYIFFEEEKQSPSKLDGTPPKPAKAEKTKKSILNHFFSTTLVSTNRNIALFYHKVSDEGSMAIGEIIICQKISIKKIVENTLYVFEDKISKFYMDRPLLIKEKYAKTPKLYLNDYDTKIDAESIVNIWQVLGKSADLQRYIDGLQPL